MASRAGASAILAGKGGGVGTVGDVAILTSGLGGGVSCGGLETVVGDVETGSEGGAGRKTGGFNSAIF